TENAYRRERPETHDSIDSLQRPIVGLEASDDLARHGAARHAGTAVPDRVEEQLLAVNARLARTHAGEPVRIHELEAERQVYHARGDERVVAREVALRRQLDPDEHADALLDRGHVRQRELDPARSLESAVKMHEGRARFLAGGPAGLDHVGQRLVARFVGADVLSGGAEAAIERRPVIPERT